MTEQMTPDEVSKKPADLTAERLRELLDYDPETGIFRWKKARKAVTVGAVAGNVWGAGYLRVKINNVSYSCHRLAWLYVYGKWPTEQIDHINGTRHDNRITNLREATASENQQNIAANKKNTSGRIGVDWFERCQKWRARIKVNGKETYLGVFDSVEDAVAARAKAKAEIHKFQPFDREVSHG